MKQGQMKTNESLFDERNNDIIASWMKVMDGLCPMEKPQKMKTP